MRNKIIICAIIAAALLLIPLLSNAQPTIGCCCDPIVKNGSFMTETDCLAKKFTFAGPPPSVSVTCSEYCKATLPPTPITPPAIPPIVTGCGSPTYRPPPGELKITPVRGQKALRLSFTLPCPADYLNISRCQGTNCENFAQVAELPPTTIFTDEAEELQFNRDYTYSISAYYSISGTSEPAIAIGNPGDIECWYHSDDKFCVNYFYYDSFRKYLTTYGYASTTATSFSTTFDTMVNLTFATRLGQAWQCNDKNKLIETSPKVSCPAGQYCISDESGARCIKKEPCGTFDPFGLYATQASCEGLPSKYCFFDKSKTAANKCYGCDPRMNCYDYKTKTACEKDNCGAGECQWKPIFEDLGIGVCVDKRYNNCALCALNGTATMENLDAHSSVWDACNEERSTALSTFLYPCFFDKDNRKSKTCDEATCSDYTALQCGSPEEGIILNPDNSLETSSTDVCGIKVCEYNQNTGCVKNADGNTGAGFQDCALGDKACEQDYFPPSTTLIPTGVAGRIDTIGLRVFDKINKTSPPMDFAGVSGYKTYLCVKNATSTCTTASTFNILVTNTTQLLLKNGLLKSGKKILAQLKTGNNTIVYYSRDKANNPEILKSQSIYACEACNGPTLLNATVTGGRFVGKSAYTSITKPTFTFEFDEPTQVTFAEISRAGETIPITQLTTGMTDKHEFTPVSPLLGLYNFTINGHNSKTIYIDPPGLQYALYVDPSSAGVNITPPDGSIFNKTTIDATLAFTKPVAMRYIAVVTESFADPYMIKDIPRIITGSFKTTDNKTFTGKIENLTGGRYKIVVDAQGYNAIDVYAESTFFIATQKPGIRMAKPEFGTTAYSVFNATIESAVPAECAYVYDTPTAPSSDDFEFLNKFEGFGILHYSSGLTIPYGAEREYLLHTYCKSDIFGMFQRTFNITLDPEPPVIIRAFAEPAVIAEQFIPGKELYSTTLKVQLSKPGFCKYSLATSSFPEMNGIFPGYDKEPKESLGAMVNVTEKKAYSYYVTCKAKNQLLSAPVSVPFTIDLSLPLSVSSATPIGFGNLSFTIGVVSNKRVFCYFGERPDDTTKCMGACTSSYTQWQKITVSNPGSYNYFVKCAHVGGEQSDIITIPVLVDTTPPIMEYVKDDGVFEDDLDVSWSKNKVRVAFKGHDEDVNISHYLVTLQGLPEKQAVVKDFVSNVTDGAYFYLSQTQNGSPFTLVNNKRYNFKVKAVSQVGLQSEPMESDGVRIDVSRTPGPCLDGDIAEGETDVDCGGPCDGCAEGKKCNVNEDCATNYCQDGTCKIASCEDGVMNGLESDVDCGGQVCNKCANERSCIIHSDCASEYCDILLNVCRDPPPCANKALDPGETDIDCGGPCDRCLEGKTCEETTDCQEGLHCKPDVKSCSSEPVGDEDFDKIMDDIDKCMGTPQDEEADSTGCGPSQRYSLGDEINDKWRIDYFGCIDCPDAAADNDYDNDKLTNLEEYKLGTNPAKKDTDGDRWKDGVEVEKGTNPLDPTSHPKSTFLGFLWTLFILLAIAGVGYGVYIILQARKEEPKQVQKIEAVQPKIIVKKELEQLRSFAKEEELPEKDWISLEKEIKKKPLPPKKFKDALERLRKITHEERPAPEQPLLKLRAMLEELSEEERKDVLAKYKLLRAGLLTKEEMAELMHQLKITAEYYKTHKQELEKEIEEYGKRKKH